MALESIQRKNNSLPMLSVDKYNRLSKVEFAALQLPDEIQRRITRSMTGRSAYADGHPDTTIDILSANQDGIKSILSCITYDQQPSCDGTMVDIQNNREIGWTSYMGYSGADYGKDTYHVVCIAGTFTSEDSRGLGFAERRLRTINEYLSKRFGVPLCSSLEPSQSAERLWKGLADRGLVELRTFPGGKGRYCFKV